MNITLFTKPLSVNTCWRGQRFKTPEYTRYERQIMALLPAIEIESVHTLHIEFGFSNKASDLDNPVKPILDILQKKYGFNDRDIYELHIKKTIVPKGNEYITINFVSL